MMNKAPCLLQMEEGVLSPDDVIIDEGVGSMETASIISSEMSERTADISADGAAELMSVVVEQETSFTHEKPEVKTELEKLEMAKIDVQLLDEQLFEFNVAYKTDMLEFRRKLYRIYKTHRVSIEKSKPYFVAKELENALMEECWKAEEDCEKARVNFEDAKEQEAYTNSVLLATQKQQGAVLQNEHNDVLENWNLATKKVLETSRLRADAEDIYRKKESQLFQANKSADMLFMELKKDCDKAWPYYAMKDAYQKELERKKRTINDTGRRLSTAMDLYNKAITMVTGEQSTSNPRANMDGDVVSNRELGLAKGTNELDSILSALESRCDALSSNFNTMSGDMEREAAELDLTLAATLAPPTGKARSDKEAPSPRSRLTRSRSVFDILLSSNAQKTPSSNDDDSSKLLSAPTGAKPKFSVLKDKARSVSLSGIMSPFKGYEKMKDA